MSSYVITVVLPAVRRGCYYLHNDLFPSLLTTEEEAECLRGLADGDDESRSCLIEHNLRLVAHIVKKFECAEAERDDLLSIGTIGLVKGISTFRPDKGVRLATYAARCIENEVLMYLRSMRNRRSEISLYETVGVDKEGSEIALIDVLGGSESGAQERIELSEDLCGLRKKLSVLDKTELAVITQRYGLNGAERVTQRMIAEGLGISRSYVSRIEKRALLKLQRAMESGV